jgi:hypothetical protein
MKWYGKKLMTEEILLIIYESIFESRGFFRSAKETFKELIRLNTCHVPAVGDAITIKDVGIFEVLTRNFVIKNKQGHFSLLVERIHSC